MSYALNAVVTPGWSVLEVRKNKEQEESESSVEFAAYDTEVMGLNAVSFNPSVIFS